MFEGLCIYSLKTFKGQCTSPYQPLPDDGTQNYGNTWKKVLSHQWYRSPTGQISESSSVTDTSQLSPGGLTRNEDLVP